MNPDGGLPLQEVSVFRLPREASLHHNSLEAWSFDGPELAVGGSGDSRRPLAIVKNREFAQHLTRCQGAQVFAISRHLDLTL